LSRYLPMLAFALVLACGAEERSFEQPLVLGGTEVSAEVLNLGEIVYERRCSGCHGERGGGDGQYASTMDPPPADLSTGAYPRTTPGPQLPTDAELRRVVTEGIEGTDMGPQPLAGEALEAVLQYLKTLAPIWREAPAPSAN